MGFRVLTYFRAGIAPYDKVELGSGWWLKPSRELLVFATEEIIPFLIKSLQVGAVPCVWV